jgi:GAF domain-containing protein
MISDSKIPATEILAAQISSFSNAFTDITDWGNLWVRFFTGLTGIAQAWVGQVADENHTVNWVAKSPSSPALQQFSQEVLQIALRHGRMHIHNDHENSTSSGLFPLFENDRLIGLVALQSQGVDFFQPQTVQWLSDLMAGVAQSLSREQYKNRERDREFSIYQKLQSSPDIKKTLTAAMEAIAAVLKADAVIAYSRNPSSQHFERLAVFGLSPMSLEKLPRQLVLGQAGKSFSAGNLPVWIEDLRDIPSGPLSSGNSGARLRSYLAFPLTAHHEMKGALEIFWKSPNAERVYQMGFLERVSEQIAFAIEQDSLLRELRQSNQTLTSKYNVIIEGLSRALELRDLETEGHSQRVCELTMRLAKNMQIPREQWDDIRRGALLHDIGKIGIPDAVLLKPGSLTQQERRMMQLHVVYAYNILSPTATSRVTLDIIHYHHEHWDGNGYPDGLKGAQIPLAARLFSAVDVFDALTSDRPYRSAWSRDHAIKYLKEQAGTQFDPLVIKSFLDVAHN